MTEAATSFVPREKVAPTSTGKKEELPKTSYGEWLMLSHEDHFGDYFEKGKLNETGRIFVDGFFKDLVENYNWNLRDVYDDLGQTVRKVVGNDPIEEKQYRAFFGAVTAKFNYEVCLAMGEVMSERKAGQRPEDMPMESTYAYLVRKEFFENYKGKIKNVEGADEYREYLGLLDKLRADLSEAVAKERTFLDANIEGIERAYERRAEADLARVMALEPPERLQEGPVEPPERLIEDLGPPEHLEARKQKKRWRLGSSPLRRVIQAAIAMAVTGMTMKLGVGYVDSRSSVQDVPQAQAGKLLGPDPLPLIDLPDWRPSKRVVRETVQPEAKPVKTVEKAGTPTFYADGPWQKVIENRITGKNPLNPELKNDSEVMMMIAENKVAAVNPAMMDVQYREKLEEIVGGLKKQGKTTEQIVKALRRNKELPRMAGEHIGQRIEVVLPDGTRDTLVILDVARTEDAAAMMGLITLPSAVNRRFVVDLHQGYLEKHFGKVWSSKNGWRDSKNTALKVEPPTIRVIASLMS